MSRSFFCSVLNVFSLARPTDMHSISELVFLLLNSSKPDWSSVTDFDLLSETSVVELNIDLTYLISSPILPSYHDMFLFNCTLLSENSVTPTGLAKFFSSSSLDNLLASNSPLIDMFFLPNLVLLCTCLQQTKWFQTKVYTQPNCTSSKVYSYTSYSFLLHQFRVKKWETVG